MGGLTSEERVVMDNLVRAWNAFVELPKQHPDDVDEFRHDFHRLQHLIMVRAIRRLYPDVYTNEVKDG
jgi:hypothetical protein